MNIVTVQRNSIRRAWLRALVALNGKCGGPFRRCVSLIVEVGLVVRVPRAFRILVEALRLTPGPYDVLAQKWSLTVREA
jgi:hypothetical protein